MAVLSAAASKTAGVGRDDAGSIADITILQDHDRLHYIMKDGKFHKENATDEAPAPDPANMPASGTEQLVTQRP